MNQILNASLHLLDDKHDLTVIDYAHDGFAVLRVTPSFSIYFQDVTAVIQFGHAVMLAAAGCTLGSVQP